MIVAVAMGAVSLPAGGIALELIDRLPFVSIDSGLTAREVAILWELRMPRVVLGGLVGASLAMSGAAYQGVFRNPLADPYLLGAAAGAGLGATLVFAYIDDSSSWPIDPLPLAAFVGALVSVLLTYILGRSGGRSRSATTLILAGVAMASFLTAVQTYFQQRESDTLQQVYAWILGRLSTSGWREVGLILPYVLLSGIGILLHRRLLDVMSVGDEEAGSLGINAARVRIVVVIAATLATAAAVAVSGLIGFVGIIVPHTIRLVFGSSYRLVLPLSILFGGSFLIVTDLVARTVSSPAELPIGVITAFFGAPFFIVVLRSSRRMA
ncbi:MAG: iron chelate uptake ABC transporter family permease subunit [Actinobacteria bacterium]|nr:iron chelate uptake ABC transporter family permease subunit [Actinomycetota bacterium]